jgi:cephalosporin hydroxylase
MVLSRAGTIAPRLVQDAFHVRFYSRASKTWRNTRFLGTNVWKNPFDLWVYQEMLSELRPEVIIECGTAYGGSALFLASMCELLGTGQVVSIDIEQRDVPPPEHPRITYLIGSSTSDEIVSQVTALAAGKSTLVILDSDHSRAHVLRELERYGPLVSEGSYIIVEDSNVFGHPVDRHHGPGPMEAIHDYLATTDEFQIDREREKYMFTFNPEGFLRRTRAD